MILNNQLEEYKNEGVMQNRSSFPVTAYELTGAVFNNTASIDNSSK